MKLTHREITERAQSLYKIAAECRLCPRRCGVNRNQGGLGFCGAGDVAEIAGFQPHFGEEKPLVGHSGSGTVFFHHCNLGCVFCQNDSISTGHGPHYTIESLAELFGRVEAAGCHNLNLVSPTHYIHCIVDALGLAAKSGFNLPVVYNCGGYEEPEVLKLLDGIVDIYMPDVKTLDADWALKLLKAPDYPDLVMKNLPIMFHQTGNLTIDDHGVAVSGTLIRHLVMPNHSEDTRHVIDLIHTLFGSDAYLNIMDQFHPCFQAMKYDELSRRITPDEWRDAIQYARQKGITRGLDWRTCSLN